jgi:diguanylate cyclase (GGDEF)-like protein/PAS domain S-box-containing protein
VTDTEGTYRLINPAGAAALARPVEAVVGRPIEALFAPADAAAVRARDARVLQSGQARTEEAVGGTRDGRPRHWMTTRAPLRDDAGRVVGVIGVARDVTEHRAFEARLRDQAERDALTGLANRMRFRARVDEALTRVGRGARAAVVFLDLDDFKRVNDTLGHAAGDDLLTHVARRLVAATRDGDTVARLGGDEFAVLLEQLDGDAAAEGAVARLLAALEGPMPLGVVGAAPVTVGASAGVAPLSAGESADAVLRNADLAMYHVKARGKGRYAVYAPAMHATVVERASLAADLAAAAGARAFHVAYQPIVDLATAAWPASRRSPAGTTRPAAPSRRRRSSRSPRRPAWWRRSAAWCSTARARSSPSGRGGRGTRGAPRRG